MKHTHLILLLLLMFFGCSHPDACVKKPESFTYQFYKNKGIRKELAPNESLYAFVIHDSTQLVFEYYHRAEECLNVFDDEYGERMAFEINPDSTSFEFSDNEIGITNCFYGQDGATASHVLYPIKKGTIKGVKLNENSWDVEIKVTTDPVFQEPPKTIEVKGTFQLAN